MEIVISLLCLAAIVVLIVNRVRMQGSQPSSEQ